MGETIRVERGVQMAQLNLKAIRVKNKISLVKLSKASGLFSSYLCDLEAHRIRDPRLSTLETIYIGLLASNNDLDPKELKNHLFDFYVPNRPKKAKTGPRTDKDAKNVSKQGGKK